MQPQLRLCDRNDPVPSGQHMHCCHDCGTAWTHNNDLPDQQITSREFDIAHSCPRCGREETFKYSVNPSDLRAFGLPVRAVLESMKRSWQRAAEQPLHLR